MNVTSQENKQNSKKKKNKNNKNTCKNIKTKETKVAKPRRFSTVEDPQYTKNKILFLYKHNIQCEAKVPGI